MAYILRQAIRETHWQAQLADVLDLCKKAPIDEVMLMEQSHQILMVPFPLEKHRRMAAIYQEFGRELKNVGIEFSINIATIVGHADAPVPENMVLPFQKFVGEDLVNSHAVYCISDSRWVEYAAEVVRIYAQTGPRRLMIDDDFRSLNHTTPYGCFCPTHATKTGEQLGLSLTPQSLKSKITEPSDQGLEVRRAWQRVNFEFQLRAARAIEAAAHQVNPSIQVGLMNSGEPANSVQGRDMDQLLSAFGGVGRTRLSRPAGGAYVDVLHNHLVDMHQTSALSYQAAGPAPTTWISEVENWPHSRFLKSMKATGVQMLVHTLWGADELSLNLYDYLATPFDLEQPITDLLVRLRPQVETLKKARKGLVLRGVSIPWHKDSSALRPGAQDQVDEIMPRRPLDSLLPLLGIPVQFEEGSVRVILGSDIRGYSDSQVRQMLTQGLLLDNVAAEELAARGFADLVGCLPEGIISAPCVERLVEKDFCDHYTGCDLPTNWFRLPQEGKWITHFKLAPDAVEVSTLLDDNDTYLGPGVVRFTNNLGGRVVVLPQEVHDLGWYHRGRSIQMHRLMAWLAGDSRLPLVYDSPNVSPFYYTNPQTRRELLALLNTGLDPQETRWNEGPHLANPHEWTELFSGQKLQTWPTLDSLELLVLVRMK